MADCMDGQWEITQIEKKCEKYPSIEDIAHMCLYLGIQEDETRTLRLNDAWDYYHELKTKVDAKKRKTA